jgi:hypothetical protein
MGAIGLASEIYERAAKDAHNYWNRGHAGRLGAHAGGPGEGQHDQQVVRIYIPANGRDPIPDDQLATLEDSEELGDGG